MQIRDKVSQHDGSGTHGRAHNNVVHASSARRADVDEDAVVVEEMAAGPRAVRRAAVVLPRTTDMEEAALEVHRVHAGVVAATKPPVEVEDGAGTLARTTMTAAVTAMTQPNTGGTIAPCA